MADAALAHLNPEEFDHSEHHTSTGLSNNKLAFWLFLGSECLLFGGLISTYFLYRGRVADGPDVQGHLRHPVHLGQLLRAADELAHHGAGRVVRAPRGRATACGCGS